MILYGQGKCFIKYNVAPIENVSIYYDGDVTLLHNYMLIHKIKANTITFKNNLQANNLLIEDVGQIHIGFINLNKSDFLLFDYKGFFKVNKAEDKFPLFAGSTKSFVLLIPYLDNIAFSYNASFSLSPPDLNIYGLSLPIV